MNRMLPWLVFPFLAPLSPADAEAAESAATVIHVSPRGNDSWSGRLPDPDPSGKDGPLATLAAGRDHALALRRAGTAGPIEVRARGGRYPLAGTLRLGPEDSGLRIAAAPGEEARICGGREVIGFRPVQDPGVLGRLDPAVRGKVLVADLKAQGIGDYGKLSRRGFGIEPVPAPIELFFGGRPMPVAGWPDGGWTKTTGAPGGPQGGRFNYEGDRPSRWAPAGDVLVHGYWTWDWADSLERVHSIDTAAREVSTEPPHGVYGYAAGKRFRFLNVLEELDTPGEWWIDRAIGLLYFLPPAPIDSAPVEVSLLESPLVTIEGARGIVLEGFVLECGRASGVEVRGGEGNLIRSSTFRDLGTSGVVVRGGKGHRVEGCELRDLGEGAIVLEGGDRRTLEPGGHSAEGNRILRFGRSCRTYRPGVLVEGVGNRVAGNRIHDAPHTAVLLGGNDHLIERNEVHHVCLETADAGAIYMGRDMSARGNVIRGNWFHDVRPAVSAAGFSDVMSVYLDDCACGSTVEGNLFVRAGRAVMIGGGRDNRVIGNVFVDCRPAIHVDARGKGWASFWFDGRDPTIMDHLKAVRHTEPPYSVRYPELARLLQDEPAAPKGNVIERNVLHGGKPVDLLDGLDEKAAGFHGNFIDGDPGFVDEGGGDYRLRDDAPARRLGIPSIPIESVGPDAWRREHPDLPPAPAAER